VIISTHPIKVQSEQIIAIDQIRAQFVHKDGEET